MSMLGDHGLIQVGPATNHRPSHRRWLSILATLAIGAVACSGSANPDTTQPAPHQQVVRGDDQPPEVTRYASPNPGSVNAYLYSAKEGLILIDSGRNVSGGRRVVSMVARTGEPVLAILLTHPHPDHVGGLGVLHEAFPQAPIYASEATAQWMRDDPLGFYPLAREADPDYPATLTYPDRTFPAGAPLEIGGSRLHTAEFGPAESETTTVYYDAERRLLFTGDLVNNHATPALLEGHSCGWLQALQGLRSHFPEARLIYPGHGSPGRASRLLAQQYRYLEDFREFVRPAIEGGSADGVQISHREQASILRRIDRRYVDYPSVASLSTLPQLNIAAVAAELRMERASDPPRLCRPR
jgi:glyoxylase-like metal-dependent hydrolase (beta-lactamase superfamily II)